MTPKEQFEIYKKAYKEAAELYVPGSGKALTSPQQPRMNQPSASRRLNDVRGKLSQASRNYLKFKQQLPMKIFDMIRPGASKQIYKGVTQTPAEMARQNAMKPRMNQAVPGLIKK